METLPPLDKKDEMTEEDRKQGFRIRNMREIDDEAFIDDIISKEYQGTPLDNKNLKQEL